MALLGTYDLPGSITLDQKRLSYDWPGLGHGTILWPKHRWGFGTDHLPQTTEAGGGGAATESVVRGRQNQQISTAITVLGKSPIKFIATLAVGMRRCGNIACHTVVVLKH